MNTLLFAFIALSVYAQALTGIETNGLCSASDPSFNNCFLGKFEKLRPSLMKGMPEIRLHGLDPLHIPYFEVHNQVGTLVKMDATIKDVKIVGIHKVTFQDIQLDPETLKFHIKLHFPEIYAQIYYDVKGNLLQLPLESKGLLIGNCTDIPLEATASLAKVNRGGEEHYKIKNMTVISRVGDAKMSLDAEDPNFQYAADAILAFFNQNPRLFFDAANPIYVEAAAQFFTQFFNPVLAKLPINQMFSA